MGDYLSTPDTEKHSTEDGNAKISYGACSMQGWRTSNEDAHITALDFAPGLSLFAVFDGHGGCEVAKYCEHHFLQELKQDKDFKVKNYEAALRNVFIKVDKMLLQSDAKSEMKKYQKEGLTLDTEPAFSAGCTANVILVTETHVYCANTGDARSVICEKGRAVDLSKDHKPDVPSEYSRVIAAGHSVASGRVDGNLAISRAIGDWEYKSSTLPPEKMAVSGYPEITKTLITPNSDFILCACDGIWDCMTSQQAVDFVKARRQVKPATAKQAPKPTVTNRPAAKKESGKTVVPAVVKPKENKGKGLAAIVEAIFDTNCPATTGEREGLGCDNMTCILIQLSTK